MSIVWRFDELHRYHLVHSAHAKPALHRVVEETELPLPIGDESDAAEVPAGGKAAYVDSVGIAAKTRCVLVDPSDAAAYLRRHHAEVSARLLHRIEVQGDIICPSIDEHLRGVAAVLGRAYHPVAAMDEDEDWRLGAVGAINIELFDFCRPISDSLGRAYTGAHGLAVGGEALDDLANERLVDLLVV